MNRTRYGAFGVVLIILLSGGFVVVASGADDAPSAGETTAVALEVKTTPEPLPEASSPGPKNVLFHVKTSLAKDDAQICVVPNAAMAALADGAKVTLLFDASAVTSITQGWGWFNWSSSTPMDKATAPLRERKSISQQFEVPLDEVPTNYGDYLRFLNRRGAEVVVNRTMLTLYEIDPKHVDPVAKPIDVKTMFALFKNADLTLVY